MSFFLDSLPTDDYFRAKPRKSPDTVYIPEQNDYDFGKSKVEEEYELLADDFRFFTREQVLQHKTFLKVYNNIRKFLFSEFYFFILCLFCYICWVTGISKAGLWICLTLVGIVLIVCRDVTPIILFVLVAPTVISVRAAAENYFDCFFSVIFPILAVIFHGIFYKATVKPSGIFYSQVVLSAVTLFGGIFCMTNQKFFAGFPFYLLFGPVVLLADWGSFTYMGKHKTVDIAFCVAKLYAWAGMIFTIDTFTLFIRSGKSLIEFLSSKSYLNYGFANPNNVGNILLLTFPMCFYLSTRYKWGFPYSIIGLLQFLAIVMTQSRGSILAGCVGLVGSIIASIIFARCKKWTAIIWGIVIILALIIICLCSHALTKIIESIFRLGLNDNNRKPLYNEAVDLFKQHPIFGVGIGYMGKAVFEEGIPFYWFHSTFYQVLACYGISGLIVYVYHYYEELKLIFVRWKTSFNWFVLIAAFGFEFYSMIDVGTFGITTVYANLFLFTALAVTNADGKDHSGPVQRENRFCIEAFKSKKQKKEKAVEAELDIFTDDINVHA